MKYIKNFSRYALVLEMKEKTKKGLYDLMNMIQSAMKNNPSGLAISEVPDTLKPVIDLAIDYNVVNQQVDKNGVKRLLLVDIENTFSLYDEIKKRNKSQTIIDASIKTDDTEVSRTFSTTSYKNGKSNTSLFMLDRADFKRVARTLPNSNYIINKIMDIKLYDLDSLYDLRKKVYLYYNLELPT